MSATNTPPPPAEDAPAGPAAGSPSSFLTAVVGEHVQVRLNSGVDYRGKLNTDLYAEPGQAGMLMCSCLVCRGAVMLGWVSRAFLTGLITRSIQAELTFTRLVLQLHEHCS